MKIRIAYYVIACAISLAAFAGAYGYADAYAITARTAADDAAGQPGAFLADMMGLLDTAAIDPTFIAGIAAGDNPAVSKAIDAARVRRAARAAYAIAITAARTAYAVAFAVSLAAFAGAYILDKRGDA